MRILVTGANGYIGSRVIKELCDMNQTVIATDISNSRIDKRAIFIEANIFSDNDDWYNFFQKPEVCLHLAWRDGFVHNSYKHMCDLSLHYNFLCNLMNSNIKRIAVMGSMHEIGYFEGMIDENTPSRPMSLYGVAKVALRDSLEIYAKSVNCEFQWLRAYYIYGNDLLGNNIFCKLQQAVKEHKSTFPLNSGKNKYDFLNIDELAKMISISICQNEVLGIIEVCSGKPISLGEQIEKYIKDNNLEICIEYGKFPERKYDSPCIYGNTEKINRILKLYESKEL